MSKFLDRSLSRLTLIVWEKPWYTQPGQEYNSDKTYYNSVVHNPQCDFNDSFPKTTYVFPDQVMALIQSSNVNTMISINVSYSNNRIYREFITPHDSEQISKRKVTHLVSG